MTATRLTLVILVMLSRNLVWIVEQPRESLLFRHRRFEWLMNVVAWVPQLEYVLSLLEAKSCSSNLRSSNANSLWCSMATVRQNRLYATATCQRSDICILDHFERKKKNVAPPTLQLASRLDFYMVFDCHKICSPDLKPRSQPVRKIYGCERTSALCGNSWAECITVPYLINHVVT